MSQIPHLEQLLGYLCNNRVQEIMNLCLYNIRVMVKIKSWDQAHVPWYFGHLCFFTDFSTSPNVWNDEIKLLKLMSWIASWPNGISTGKLYELRKIQFNHFLPITLLNHEQGWSKSYPQVKKEKSKVNWFSFIIWIICNSFKITVGIPDKMDLGQPGCVFPPFG